MKQAGTLDSPDLALALTVALLLEVPALSLRVSSLLFAGWSILCVPFQNLIGHYIAYSSHIVREAKSMLDHISNCVKAKGECEIGDGWRIRCCCCCCWPQQTVMAMLHCLAPAAEQLTKWAIIYGSPQSPVPTPVQILMHTWHVAIALGRLDGRRVMGGGVTNV